jgi:hypothetical protein
MGRDDDTESMIWSQFRLWPAQLDLLMTFQDHQRVCVLKARQLGISRVAIAYALWAMLFRPIAVVLMFSKRDDEAIRLLERLRGMHRRLPNWLRPESVESESKHGLKLATESEAIAFPTTGGRSYTATLVVIDEADYIPDLASLLTAVKPTVDAGGKLLLISTADKGKPDSTFKRIYVNAKQGRSTYAPVFCPWSARPERTSDWYERQRLEFFSQHGSLDELHQEFPATDTEALAPRSLDKRIAPQWLEQCYAGQQPLTGLPNHFPIFPGLEVYVAPCPGRNYVIGADPAEGNPTSDDSALTIMDRESGEEVAAVCGKFEPGVLAAHADTVGRWYNNAAVLVERNNHGHAFILWMKEHSKLKLLAGFDGGVGWLTSPKGKAVLLDKCADAFRQSETLLHSFGTYVQLASIEGATLRAPEGLHDDRAISYALCCMVCQCPDRYPPSRPMPPRLLHMPVAPNPFP